MVEAQGKLLLAKQFPRNYTQSYTKAIEACQRKGFAKSAFYSYPRGKETVTGVTIRFAEELARCYGNMDYGIKELSHEDGRSEMQAYAWDLETNTISSQNFTVEHIRETRYEESLPLSDRVRTLVAYFSKKGVTQEMIEKRLNHKVETMTSDELVEYTGIYNGLIHKETTVSDWFEQPKTASQISELMKEEEENEKKGDK